LTYGVGKVWHSLCSRNWCKWGGEIQGGKVGKVCESPGPGPQPEEKSVEKPGKTRRRRRKVEGKLGAR